MFFLVQRKRKFAVMSSGFSKDYPTTTTTSFKFTRALSSVAVCLFGLLAVFVTLDSWIMMSYPDGTVIPSYFNGAIRKSNSDSRSEVVDSEEGPELVQNQNATDSQNDTDVLVSSSSEMIGSDFGSGEQGTERPLLAQNGDTMENGNASAVSSSNLKISLGTASNGSSVSSGSTSDVMDFEEGPELFQNPNATESLNTTDVLASSSNKTISSDPGSSAQDTEKLAQNDDTMENSANGNASAVSSLNLKDSLGTASNGSSVGSGLRSDVVDSQEGTELVQNQNITESQNTTDVLMSSSNEMISSDPRSSEQDTGRPLSAQSGDTMDNRANANASAVSSLNSKVSLGTASNGSSVGSGSTSDVVDFKEGTELLQNQTTTDRQNTTDILVSSSNETIHSEQDSERPLSAQSEDTMDNGANANASAVGSLNTKISLGTASNGSSVSSGLRSDVVGSEEGTELVQIQNSTEIQNATDVSVPSSNETISSNSGSNKEGTERPLLSQNRDPTGNGPDANATVRTSSSVDSECDLYHGQWYYDSTGPLYTNNTCPILTQSQNCQGNGRPDKEYENWRWKPDHCELPRFNATKFFELMSGKSLVFVGDSIARNQMESLLCILWQVEAPKNVGNRFMQRWYFRSKSITIARIWSAWFVNRTSEQFSSIPDDVVKLNLDIPDEAFMRFIPSFDVVVFSNGHWFPKSAVYILNNEVVGTQLLSLSKPQPTKVNNIEAFQISTETSLTAMVTHPNYTGLTIVTSYSPDHYEHGAWNTGGSCTGKVGPLGPSELVENNFTSIMHEKQVTGFKRASNKVTNGSKLRLMDITRVFSYRHDGHPGPYRSLDPNKVTKRGPNGLPPPQDCLHWCMPGPVDTWNELMLEVIRRDFEGDHNSVL